METSFVEGLESNVREKIEATDDKRERAKVLVDEIRNRYPDAISIGEVMRDDIEDEYCVLGAASRFAGVRDDDTFPINPRPLQVLNPDLVRVKAIEFALDISKTNDQKSPIYAWHRLEDALAYPE